MALDFPGSPLVDQIYTNGGKSWVWTGTFWNAVNQGIQGVQGIQGIQGIQGQQGITGSQGTQGQQGIQGIQGAQGRQGITGSQGTQGNQGIQGITGSQGTQGQQGIQGITGSQGAQGQQGIQGITGSGAQGAQGQQGITGSQGAQGLQGITGSQGTQGQQGITGSQGTQGNQGITGAGAQGAQGIQGQQGIQGAQGIQGVKGTKVTALDTPPLSPSVNDFWWDATYGVLMVYYDDGNSQQWVSAMSGISGIQGAQGIAGPGNTIASTDDTSTNSTFYPVIVGGTGSQTAKVSTTKLTFNPSTGDLSAAGNITAYFSDDRLKDRIGNISDAMRKVETLNGFYFIPNQKAQELGYQKKLEVGISAQEVEAVLPEVVTAAPINSDYKTVYYDRLIPLLIEALKEQNVAMRALSERLAKLETPGK